MIPQKIKEFYNKMHPISDLEWEQISDIFTKRTIKKNELFLQAQDINSNFAVIESGIFRLYYISDDGKEWNRAFRRKNEVIGTFSDLFQNQSSQVYIQALADSTVYQADVHELFKRTNQSLNWQILQKKIAVWFYIQKEKREYEFLKMNAAERLESCKENLASHYEEIPEYHIASYLGITPQALSRLQRTS